MLYTRNVFVDTQAFLQYKFRFDHPPLKRLLDICVSRKLQLVLTEPVVGEIRAKLKEQIAEGAKSLGQFHKLSGAVEGHLSERYPGLLNKPSESELIEHTIKAWEKYQEKSNAFVVPASAVTGSELLDLYFGTKPPFGDGRKKNEFPDAISVLSLTAWMRDNREKIYVVSQDNDLESWCAQAPNVYHVKSLNEFLDLYNRTEEKLTKLVHTLFTNEQSQFLKAIKDQFHNCGFLYAENWDADVENIEVANINIDKFNIIDIEDTKALVSVIVQIEFTASISGPDYDNGYWDSEDKKYAYLPEFNIKHTFSEHYEASIEFEFSAETESIECISDAVIEDGGDITLSINDGYP